ncbi:hydroxymethylglutaryl-CoA reductase, degradative [Mammaliicoccus fleurettii]|uniref:hydroxymethylglutaryl-CoA reductase, degradative n=1 Tax=Mammaliicoccus fleurettii TaxID=150056 RepID=UPI001AADA3C3|nr:hydroxymethylglutaryl-CoA reductase, degradative [Mammaliicoccus fleurettii]MBO3061382.1 hydroxymethylglutaryl-CoA reductase, degradative [Mammaliicoccus fleurettii]MEB8069072.1 hydroxymethylglutaryl-CoA reductase, degradative [Mammaliicoccus fleurettii]
MKPLTKDFRHLSRPEKINQLKEHGWIQEQSEQILLNNSEIDKELLENLIENVIGQGTLPVGVLPEIIVNGKSYAVPMMVEEPSVVAAASYGSKLFNKSGGLKIIQSDNIKLGQIVFDNVIDTTQLSKDILELEQEIHQTADQVYPSILKRGGGYQKIETDEFPEEGMLSLKVYIDTRDAMGANIINTILEGIAHYLEEQLDDTDILMSILSNYSTTSVISIQGEIAVSDLEKSNMSGEEVAHRMERASVLAHIDPYRAVTHNKGVMNGISSVVLASGNDTRSVEAGAHAYASKDGQYRSLTTWKYDREGQCLVGTIELPLTLGIIGGSIDLLPMSKVTLDILNVESAQELAHIVAAVGLAQNFSACRALVSEGIQHGHMNLHYKSLAIKIGAKGVEINLITEALKNMDKPNLETAQALLYEMRNN